MAGGQRAGSGQWGLGQVQGEDRWRGQDERRGGRVGEHGGGERDGGSTGRLSQADGKVTRTVWGAARYGG